MVRLEAAHMDKLRSRVRSPDETRYWRRQRHDFVADKSDGTLDAVRASEWGHERLTVQYGEKGPTKEPKSPECSVARRRLSHRDFWDARDAKSCARATWRAMSAWEMASHSSAVVG